MKHYEKNHSVLGGQNSAKQTVEITWLCIPAHLSF